MATRQPTPPMFANQPPSIMDSVLAAQTDAQMVRAELKYDYSLIDAAIRGQVQDAAVAIAQAGKRYRESKIVIGQRLIEVKALLPHGQFGDWCMIEYEMSLRMAEYSMSIAEAFDDKPEIISAFSDTALLALAAPSTPPAAREEVIAQAQATGIRPKVSEVKATIAKHKPAPPAQMSIADMRVAIREIGAAHYVCPPASSASDMRAGAKHHAGAFWRLVVGRLPTCTPGELELAISMVADDLESTRDDAWRPPGFGTRTVAAPGSLSNLQQAQADQDARAAAGGVWQQAPARSNYDQAVASGLVLPPAAPEEYDDAAGNALAGQPPPAADNGKRLVDWTDADWAAHQARQAAPAAPEERQFYGPSPRMVVPTPVVVDATAPQPSPALYATGWQRRTAIHSVLQAALNVLPDVVDMDPEAANLVKACNGSLTALLRRIDGEYR